MAYRALAICSVLLWISIVFAQTRTEYDSTLAGVKKLYDSGSYINAELQARRVVEEKDLPDSLRVQFEKYIAFSLVAQDRSDDAMAHFQNALKIDSTFSLDTVLTSPKILAVFERAKSRYLSDKRKVELQQKEGQELERGNYATAGGSEIYHGGGQVTTFRALLFPGWEQLYRGDKKKGYTLLAAGAAAGLSAITSDLLRRNARSNYLSATTSSLAASRYNTYNTFYQAEYYSISAFILIYAYSAMDSFLSLPPHFGVDYYPATLNTQLHFQFDF
jgi:hypothetical protein